MTQTLGSTVSKSSNTFIMLSSYPFQNWPLFTSFMVIKDSELSKPLFAFLKSDYYNKVIYFINF